MMNAGRKEQIHLWLRGILGERFSVSGLTGDASFRKYYRIKTSVQSFVLMDADHEEENLRQFVFVSKRLQSSGLHVPTIEHADFQKNLLLLEDLGDQLLLSCINDANAGYFYRQAIQDKCVRNIWVTAFPQQMTVSSRVPDKSWLKTPCRGHKFSSTEITITRNILVQSDGLAHIDYQDAVTGPLCYDLVSLLKDCYIKWPNEKIEVWIDDYLSLRSKAGHVQTSR